MNSASNSCFSRAPRSAFLGLILLVVSLPLAAQQGFASLEEQMTGDEFTAAGLEKLSPQELASLNAWIRSRSLATLDGPRYSAAPTSAASQDFSRSDIENMEREPFTTRINGPFAGWDGQTVFKLENGMIWAQADKDKFFTNEIQSPMVTIEPALFGDWKLSVEGYDKTCRVERIQ